MDFIVLPETFIADILGLTSDLFNNLSPLIILIISILLGFFIVEGIINIIRKKE